MIRLLRGICIQTVHSQSYKNATLLNSFNLSTHNLTQQTQHNINQNSQSSLIQDDILNKKCLSLCQKNLSMQSSWHLEIQTKIQFGFGIFRKERLIKNQAKPNKSQQNDNFKNSSIRKQGQQNSLQDKQKQQKGLFKSKSRQEKLSKQSPYENAAQQNEQQNISETNKDNIEESQYSKKIYEFKKASTIKQLISIIDKIQTIKCDPIIGNFMHRMTQLLTYEEFIKNRKEVATIIYDIKSYINQKNYTADELISIFYFFKKAKDFGHEQNTQGFQVRSTQRLFQLFKNNELTFEQILFIYYITAYLKCQSHEFKWHLSMCLVKQHQIYRNNKYFNKAGDNDIKNSIILNSKNQLANQRVSFLQPTQWLMIMVTFQYQTLHLVSDYLIYEISIQNIWKQKVHNRMTFTQKVQLFNIYLSFNTFLLIQKIAVGCDLVLCELKAQFKKMLQKQQNFYLNNKWLSIIQNINLCEHNYNKLSYLHEVNLLHLFCHQLVKEIKLCKEEKGRQALIKLILTPVMNKTIKFIYKQDEPTIKSVLNFVKQYFRNTFYKDKQRLSQSRQILQLWIGFINVDYPKIQADSIFTQQFLKLIYTQFIITNKTLMNLSQLMQPYWMVQFSYLSFQTLPQIQHRIQQALIQIYDISSPSKQRMDMYGLVCKFYAYLTKYLQINRQSNTIQSLNVKKYEQIKQTLKYTMYNKKIPQSEKQQIKSSNELIQFLAKIDANKIHQHPFNLSQFFITAIQNTKYYSQYDLAQELIDQILQNIQIYSKQIPLRCTQQVYCLKTIFIVKDKNTFNKDKCSKIFDIISKKMINHQILQIMQANLYPKSRALASDYFITDFSTLQVQTDKQLLKQNYKFFCEKVFPFFKLGHFNFIELFFNNILKYDADLRKQIFKIVYPTIQQGLKDGKFQLMKNSKLCSVLSKIISENLIYIEQNKEILKVFQNIDIHTRNQDNIINLVRNLTQMTKNLLASDLLSKKVQQSLKKIVYTQGKFTFNFSSDLMQGFQNHLALANKSLLDKYQQYSLKNQQTQNSPILITQFLHLQQYTINKIIKNIQIQQFPNRVKIIMNALHQGLAKYKTLLQNQNKQIKQLFYKRKQQIQTVLQLKFKQFLNLKVITPEEKRIMDKKMKEIKTYLKRQQ